VAAGSESLWLGEGWSFDRLRMVHGELVEPSPLPFIPSHGGEGRFWEDISEKVRDKFSDFIV